MSESPYKGKSISEHKEITEKLIQKHPLSVDVIKEISLLTWDLLWQTKIGSGSTSIMLRDINVPATVVGYFFEILFSMELSKRYPTQWRGFKNKDDKDIVCIDDNNFSFEIKTSGQLSTKIYGNRSYGQKVESNEKKDKSGFYLTINFYETTLNLIRFGWIDFDDWIPQKSPTGQMAGLSDNVYQNKLKIVDGDYRLNAPVQLIEGIGGKTAEYLNNAKIFTIGDLKKYSGTDAKIKKIKENNLKLV